jgi:hypothetical protein
MNTGLVAELLVEAQVEFEQDERFTEFFRYHTLGLPLAFFVLTEAVTGLNTKGEEILEETWTDFCRILNVDPELEWTSIHEMLLGFMFDDDEDEDSE